MNAKENSVQKKPHPFKSVRRANVPLVLFETVDPAATIVNCVKSLNSKADTTPMLEWDLVRGLRGVNDLGERLRKQVAPEGAIQSANPAECLSLLYNSGRAVPDSTIVFWHNAHRFIDNEAVAQGIWNLRDPWKNKGATLVMLAPACTLPSELKQDIVVIDEPLPSPDEVGEIVDSLMTNSGVKPPVGEARSKVVDTLLGLSAFNVEQVLALSLVKDGVDTDSLWERKRKIIESTPGLTVWRSKSKLSDLGGLENAKKVLADICRGKLGIRALVFFDEIDKSFAAAGTDTSGTTQYQNKVLLTHMQDKDIVGGLFLGPPGTGKTELCKAIAAEFGLLLVMFDLGATKGSLVGQSEAWMRGTIKVIEATTANKALYIGACNRVDTLPPELRRRFNFISMFFDLPTKLVRDDIARIYVKKNNLTPEQDDWSKVDDTGWAGAEIRNAALKAWAMDCSLSEAAKTIVPISITASKEVEELRRTASGRHISAGNPGLYQYEEALTAKVAVGTVRKVTL